MARTQKNVLWIMCDQLRHDYLGCTGHPTLKTSNIDAMARRGVRFSQAYVQSPICGPSRMCFYTGRYMRSHGSHWNGWPLRVGEPTLGDHLKKIGVRNVLVGKTHMAPDLEGLKRLGIAPDSIIGVHASECGFEPYERDDGLHPTQRSRPRYDTYLRPGSIGRIPAPTPAANCRMAGCWCTPIRPRVFRKSIPRRPT
jgi:arylsulfatase A-like enzyme